MRGVEAMTRKWLPSRAVRTAMERFTTRELFKLEEEILHMAERARDRAASTA